MREIAQCFKKYGFESDKDLTYKCASDFTIEDAEKALDIIKLALVNDECFINIIKNPLNDKENVFFLYSKRVEQLLLHFIDLENKNPCIVYNYLTWDNLCEEWKEILFDNICEENGTIEISIYLGDWKHSHKRLDYLMGLIDYELIKEVEEPNDDDEYDDAYTSVHYYKFKGLNK